MWKYSWTSQKYYLVGMTKNLTNRNKDNYHPLHERRLFIHISNEKVVLETIKKYRSSTKYCPI
jgi:Gpi18-like mannosyltransferase